MDNAENHHRRSIRIKGYDYRQTGAYFVTLVTFKRECLFGEVVGEQVRLTTIGEVAGREWARLERRFPYIRLDEYLVMPNHVHGIVVIGGGGLAEGSWTSEARFQVAGKSLGAVMRTYKSSLAGWFNRSRFAKGNPLWQRNYYEHILRNEWDLERVREYIRDNPKHWAQDEENPGIIFNKSE
jgi:REP element-mobilizing transposase RayT